MSPQSLWNDLLALVPIDYGASLEMLRDSYKKNCQNDNGVTVCKNFEDALASWSDDETKEFLCKWVFDPPHSTEIQEATSERRRELLLQIHKFIFL